MLPPPPRPNNTAIWLLAANPIIAILIEAVVAGATRTPHLQNLWWIAVLLNSSLSIWDQTNVRNAGARKVHLAWAIFFVPVYMFRRAAVTDRQYAYAIVWLVSFFVSIVLAAVLELALRGVNA